MWSWIALYMLKNHLDFLLCELSVHDLFSSHGWSFFKSTYRYSSHIKEVNLLSVIQIANICLSSCIITMLFLLTVSFIYVSLCSTKRYSPSMKERTFLLNITRRVLFRSSSFIYQQSLKEGTLLLVGRWSHVYMHDHWGTYLGCLSKLISRGHSKDNQLLTPHFLTRDGRQVLDESVSCCLGGRRENS